MSKNRTYTREELEAMPFEQLQVVHNTSWESWHGTGPGGLWTKEDREAYERMETLVDTVYKERKVKSPLEVEFAELLTGEIPEQIASLVAEASKKLDEAVRLADAHGIPFYSDVSFLGQEYYPAGSKFAELDEEVLEEYELWPEDGWYGWEHSAVC